jgi:hypothetical protein
MPSKGNVCILCGKDRVLLKTWKETSTTAQGSSELTYTLFACPDPDCQKKVDASLEEKRKTAQERQDAADQRKEDRNASRSKATKKAD